MRPVRDLLFLAHRIPCPPDKGDKIRSWNILRYPGERYRVHLGCFVDDPHDWRHRHELMERCASRYFARLRPFTAAINRRDRPYRRRGPHAAPLPWGVQNKVLEAMAMTSSRIATPCALEGIAAEPGHDVVMAGADDSFAEEAIEILLGNTPRAIGTNARTRVLDDYRWPASLARLVAPIEGDTADKDGARSGSAQLRAVEKP